MQERTRTLILALVIAAIASGLILGGCSSSETDDQLAALEQRLSSIERALGELGDDVSDLHAGVNSRQDQLEARVDELADLLDPLVDWAPEASIGLDPEAPVVGQPVMLTDTSTDKNNGIMRWEWMVEGQTRTQSDIEWTFTEEGVYSVSLQVWDSKGHSDTATRSIEVESGPEASFLLDPEAPIVGQPVTLTDTSTDKNNDIARREWTVEGQTRTQSDIDWAFTEEGVYSVSLQVWDSKGHSDTAVRSIRVAPAPPSVKITYIHYDGAEFRSEGDEYVVIKNTGDTDQDITGWRLKDKNDQHQSYTFERFGACDELPDNLLEPETSIRVYTNRCYAQYGSHSFARGSAVWNNDGDTAQLLDDQGNLIDEFSYGDGGD